MGIGTAIIIDMVVTRLLTPSDAGVFFLLANVLAFGAVVGMFGLNTAMVRFVSEGIGLKSPSEAREALRAGWSIAAISIPCMVAVCLITMWFWGIHVLHIPNPTVLLPLLGLCLLAFPLLQLISGVLRSFHDSRVATLLTGQFGGPACHVVFLTMLVAAALVSKPTVATALGLSALSMLLMIPLALWYLSRISSARIAEMPAESRTTPRPMVGILLAACLPLVLSQLFSFCTGFGDMWVAGSMVSHEDLALYAASRRLMLMIGMPMQLVNLTVIASIAELRAQGKNVELQRLLRGAATLAAIPAIGALVALVTFPGQIAALIFGPFYATAAPILVLLSLGQIAFVSAGSAELTLMMTGQQRSALAVNCFTSLALALAGILATQQFGVIGLAAATTSVGALQVLLFVICVKRSIGVWTIVDPTLFSIVWERLRRAMGSSSEALSK
ncbi:lipopolysaccharide biosynthesis protein [Anatilimnocola aggregata]|uniref:lipopolysaccharide biosynthesis protein n=1 Tax=Anatilimnocola aggregata TaxID=2528021 RepID=UPI001EE3BC42|nr:lipopolysaccharide biosynthesis protein [Anatilimnocola aggregata]